MREDWATLFAKLQDPTTQPEFFARVADDVDWTVQGKHPLAGRYHSKAQLGHLQPPSRSAIWMRVMPSLAGSRFPGSACLAGRYRSAQ